jgi:polyphosphate kinase
MMRGARERFVNRDLSWLHFNARVLQEAQDKRNPLIERVRFLGIFSNNRDEFFRVRYASIQRLDKLSNQKKVIEQLGGWTPQDLMQAIQDAVHLQNSQVEKIYEDLMVALEAEGIALITEEQLTKGQEEFVRKYYIEKISPSVFTMILRDNAAFPELNDGSIYLAIQLHSEGKTKMVQSLIEVPTDLHGRFVALPKYGKNYLMYLDDVLRYNLRYAYFIFPADKIEAHAFKISRDAELDMDHHDVSKTMLDRIRRGLEDRLAGDPVRMAYDADMPASFLTELVQRIGFEDTDALNPGGRYHNKRDLMRFPNVGGPHLEHPQLPPIMHPELDLERSLLQVIRQKDILIYTPYHTFSYVIRFLRESAMDPHVESISITLYRLASQSRIISALINAAKNGKKVQVVIELQARFDEQNNIHYLEKMRKEGIEVQTGVEGLKVHSKIISVVRQNGKGRELFSVIGTGNFHEETAKVYTDYFLFTADKRINKEVQKVFQFLAEPYRVQKYKHLLVSPHFTRKGLLRCIDQEIAHAKAGKKAEIWMKFNSLSSYDMGQKLYEASQAGVMIKLIVRGVCCVKPGVKGLSENIHIISVVDRFLEHNRVYAFSNDGNWHMYVASFDLMSRNLDLRVEVGTPIYCTQVQRQILDHLDCIWKDNVKARVLQGEDPNAYRKIPGRKVRSQVELYQYVQQQLKFGGRI